MLSIFDHGPPPPCPRPFNMAAHVLAAGAATPEKTALMVLGATGSEDWSFARLRAAVLGTATGLLAQGLAPGDVVLMRLGNTVDFPLAYLGAIAAGLVPCPTSAALTPREVAAILEGLKPKAVLRDPAVASAPHDTEIALGALQAMRELPPAAFHLGDPDRLAYVIYTSGTSGVPRAVGHAHRAIWARRMMFDGWHGLRTDDRLMHAGAFNWTYTLGTGLMDPWTRGATALIPAPGSPSALLPDLLAAHRATIFAAAPGVYRQILSDRDRLDLPHLRHGLSAGEKLAPRLAADWTAASGKPVYEAYGMSECSTFISAGPGGPVPSDCIGRPQPGRRVAILGPDGPVPRGAEGTIAVHRDDPGLMLGYLGAPEETCARMRGPWFLTGDQGAMHDDDSITYLGRGDDMMNAGGYRVSPIEVEQALAGFPGLTGVGAADVEIKRDTRVIAAFYSAAGPLDEDALRRYARERLARYKQPRLFVHLPELPFGANGKLLRRRLRESFEAKE
ncbi:class I adenylate-forming enzyme family protein [Sulfitobacter sp. D35]|uniref:class I adenylate-forming enzyme family protein n=1 Tax=Sulfitobacter sp. D35 TaxID=3083252 RepID=UPI00296EED24|nr:class I adenylate-forming enzyme family protein [Sulfitobacter sp. D35]MDW4497805.1 class I adenylate-forming enzyme family protein [Sulfitobacter sp. D35]